MKKILGLAAGLLITAMSFAQSGVSFNDAKDGYDKKATQTFNFTFNSDYSVDEINKNAAFYTNYFTVTATPADGNNNVVITLVEDTEMNRRIVTRFFMSMEVDQINVNGTDMPTEDFMGTYVML